MSFMFGGTRFEDGIPLKGVRSEHLADRLILPSHLSSSIFGAVGQISVIDPDDPAAAGATGLVADAGHQHAWTTAAVTSLTRTATNTEGSAGTGTRSDHGHGTENMAWGEMGGNTITADQAGIGAGPTDLTSFTATFTPLANRRLLIFINLTAQIQTSSSAWQIHCLKDGSSIGRFHVIEGIAGQRISGAGFVRDIGPTNASHTYKATATRYTGTGTLDIQNASGINGQFSVLDCGPQ